MECTLLMLAQTTNVIKFKIEALLTEWKWGDFYIKKAIIDMYEFLMLDSVNFFCFN